MGKSFLIWVRCIPIETSLTQLERCSQTPLAGAAAPAVGLLRFSLCQLWPQSSSGQCQSLCWIQQTVVNVLKWQYVSHLIPSSINTDTPRLWGVSYFHRTLHAPKPAAAWCCRSIVKEEKGKAAQLEQVPAHWLLVCLCPKILAWTNTAEAAVNGGTLQCLAQETGIVCKPRGWIPASGCSPGWKTISAD